MLKLVESYTAHAEETQPDTFPAPSKPRAKKRGDSRAHAIYEMEHRRQIEATLNSDCTTYGEQALWRAVITQALMDAGSKSHKPEAKLNRARSIAWFSKRNPDFQLVCALAGLDVDYVFENAHKAIRQECKWRQEPSDRQKNKR